LNTKRPLKNPIKYQIQLSDEQKEAKQLIENSKVTVLYGKAGTSKTAVATITALNLIFTKEFDKLYIMRPAVATEEIGFLKGDFSEKVAPFLVPIMQNLYKAYNKQKIDSMVQDGTIEIMALSFVQGVTIGDRECIVIDEAENCTERQIRQICTRLGKGGKMIFTGDTNQVMLPDASKSGFSKLLSLCGQVDGFSCQELKTNYRDPFVEEILKLY
jgi:phosphate starvation-inducible PhoH-like protein